MSRLPLFLSLAGLLSLTACAVPTPEADAATARVEPIPPVPTGADGVGPTNLSLDELATADVRGTAEATARILAELHKRPEEQQQLAAKALVGLQTTCPFNRAAVQIPLAMQRVVARTRPDQVARNAQQDWQYLRQGLDAHVGVIDWFDAGLPEPQQGDFLFGRVPEEAVLTRGELMASDAPLADTQLLVDQIRGVVDQYDQTTQDELGMLNSDLRLATWSEHWPMLQTFRGWHKALIKLEPLVEEPARKTEIREMITLLDGFLSTSC